MVNSVGRLPYSISVIEYKRITDALYSMDRFDPGFIRLILNKDIPHKHWIRLQRKLQREGRLAGLKVNKDAPPVELRCEHISPLQTAKPVVRRKAAPKSDRGYPAAG